MGGEECFPLRKGQVVSWGMEGEKAASSFIPWASMWEQPPSQGIREKMSRPEEKLPFRSLCLPLVAKG